MSTPTPAPDSGQPQPGPAQPVPNPPGYPPAGNQPTYQPGYQPTYQPGYQPGYPAPPVRPRKPRPKAYWWGVGAVLLVAGIVIGTVLFVTMLTTVTHTDALVPLDGNPHHVTVAAHSDKMLFSQAGVSGTCEVHDSTGKTLPLTGITGDITVGTGGVEWRAVRRIKDAGTGNLTVTCIGDPADSTVRIGPAMDLGGFFGRFGLIAGSYLVLGGGGAVILLVTLILWVSRSPRKATLP